MLSLNVRFADMLADSPSSPVLPEAKRLKDSLTETAKKLDFGDDSQTLVFLEDDESRLLAYHTDTC